MHKDMSSLKLLTGAEAAAEAMRQMDPDVVPIYPITPQTPIIQTFAKFASDGKVATEIINVESEHSAMSATLASAMAGARTMTATSSQGMALMVEIVHIAASMRAPIVMAVGNRALSGPINIHADHSDGMLARDSGWVHLYAENAQEAYDLMVMAPRIAEHQEVLLPVMVGQDGFTITHSAEPVELLPDGEVKAFVGPYHLPQPLLDLDNPVTVGPFAMPDAYFELRYQQTAALRRAVDVFEEVARDYEALSGRKLEVFESYKLDDAERVIVLIGSTAGTAKETIDRLRSRGEKVGLLKVRMFRPFPFEAVREALAGIPSVAVLDRADSPGGAAPLYAELASALFGQPVRLDSYVYGLGGREIFPEDLEAVFGELTQPEAPGQTRYIGLRRSACQV